MVSRKGSKGKAGSSSPRPDENDVLAWWRSVERIEIERCHCTLRKELRSRTHGRVSNELFSRIESKGEVHAETALTIAAHLHRRRAARDLMMSWVADAALSGSAVAHRMLADGLINIAIHALFEGEGMHAILQFNRAAEWLEHCPHLSLSCEVVFSTIGRRNLRKVLDELEEYATSSSRNGRRTHLTGRELSDAEHPTLLVAKEIGDKTGREGGDIAKRYEALTRPLALRGGRIPPEAIATALQLEFPWLQGAIELVVQDLVLMQAAGIPWTHINPTLLVGPPGTGKTRFAQRVGAMTGTGSSLLSAAGSSDNRALMGTARGWSSAQPAFPLLAMARTGSANPVIVVDEVDKAGTGGRNGDITATLLMLLERESAKTWLDECLLTSCDLSQVSWLLTANSIEKTSKPLLSRVRVVQVETPQREHFDAVFAGIFRDIASEMMLPLDLLPDLHPKAVSALREEFGQGASVRKLRAAVLRALAFAFTGTRRLN